MMMKGNKQEKIDVFEEALYDQLIIFLGEKDLLNRLPPAAVYLPLCCHD